MTKAEKQALEEQNEATATEKKADLKSKKSKRSKTNEFELLSGSYIDEDGQKYITGDVIVSERDLEQVFKNQFKASK